MVVSIAKVEGQEAVSNHANNTKENKIVLYFQENIPKMILNITNANTLSILYGEHIEDWEGKKIQLTTVKVKAFGKMHDALRIRDVVPKGEVTILEAEKMLKGCKTSNDLKEV
jgi:hypothetical protein